MDKTTEGKRDNEEKDTCLGDSGNGIWRSENDAYCHGYAGG